MKAEKLTDFTDARGTLVAVEFNGLPFVPNRIFYIRNVPQGTVRGGHGHYKTKQYYICLQGLIVVRIHASAAEHEVVILKPGHALLVPEMVWTSEEFCVQDCVLLVVCSEAYSKEDYFTDKPNGA